MSPSRGEREPSGYESFGPDTRGERKTTSYEPFELQTMRLWGSLVASSEKDLSHY
jgi:hypothetical protein